MKLITNAINIIKSLTLTKKFSLILLPFVLIGLFNIFTQRNVNVIQAVDPLIVTYDGGPPPNPMFEVANMLPGDEVEKTFNVLNDSADSVDIEMRFVKTDEEKDFSAILDTTVEEVGGSVLYEGKLKNLFDIELISLGTFPAGSNKDFRVKVKFPSSAGNEYQEALVIFNIIWSTDLPPIELPEECRHLTGIITTVVEGTEEDDDIFASPASELILAKGGRDSVDGNKGDDCIVGGDGADRDLDGSDGNDVIIGGNGNDDIRGGDNNDIIYGNDGDDEIDAGDNKDIVFGGGGNDKIDGGSDNDFIDGGVGDDEIDGESGDDYILGGDGNDELDGGSENDEIYGGPGDDEIDGGSGNDYLYGNEGNDFINGSSGNDNIYGDIGDDDLEGGSGNDYVNGGPDSDSIDGDSGSDTCELGESYSSCEVTI